ncbi:unnamed protein product, partial [Hapterophycus canaliculatus]
MHRLADASGRGYVMANETKNIKAKEDVSGGSWEAGTAATAGGPAEGALGGSDGNKPTSAATVSAKRGTGTNDNPVSGGSSGSGSLILHEESRLLLEQAGVSVVSKEDGGDAGDGGNAPGRPNGAGDGVQALAAASSLPSPGGSVASMSSTVRADSIQTSSSTLTVSEGGDGGGASYRRRFREPSSFKYCKELRNRAEEVVTQALELYSTKGLKKAVQYLVASNFISDTPRDIANFLRIYKKDLDPLSIGDFLSEPDVDGGEYWKSIRLQYVRAIAFHGMTLEEALRHLLTDSGFRLPGESQKVDRLLSSFAECYVADNRDNPTCPFSNSDTPFILSFAIIMLNTDLHRANAGKGRRRRRRMSKEEFISNLRWVSFCP